MMFCPISWLNETLFTSDKSHYHECVDITFSWGRPLSKYINEFNPLVKDRNGCNFFETYLWQIFAPTLRSLASMGTLDLYSEYKRKLLAKWVPVDSRHIEWLYDTAIALYSKGIRDAAELTFHEFFEANDEHHMVLRDFKALTTVQFANAVCNWEELDEMIHINTYIEGHPEHIQDFMHVYLKNASAYGISNIKPLPTIFAEYIKHNTVDGSILEYLYEIYTDNSVVLNMFSDDVRSQMISMLMARWMTISSEVLNAEYGKDHTLLQRIVDATCDYQACTYYADLINDIDPAYKDADGRTFTMKYIVKFLTLPKFRYLHDPNIKDNEGKTCRDLWRRHVGYDVPNEIAVKIFNTVKHGCEHFSKYEYIINDCLYCDDCSKDIVTRQKIFTNGESCPICWENYDANTIFAKYINCNHVLCSTCAAHTEACPLCRN